MNDLKLLILQECQAEWLKVARVIWAVRDAAGLPDTDEIYDDVESALRSLVNEGFVDLAGDIAKWRHSEVRLSKR